MILSDKYRRFLRTDAKVEMLEGVTAAGKTTVGLLKFMLKVAESSKKEHIIAARTTGVAEKNLINKDLGIIDNFGALAEYNGNGNKDEKLPHILFKTNKGDKVIYVLGYSSKDKWENALGGQYGCLYIDEVNTANIDFVREASMRADYFMGTLNPDAPDLPVYAEYVNHCRPLQEYENDAPIEIQNQLQEQAPKEGWIHWFFNFKDNAGLSDEKREQIINSVAPGTKLYKNKIQGLRGRAQGLVFSNFIRRLHVLSISQCKKFIRNRTKNQKEYFAYFTSGLDTSYSSKSPDTIAMSFMGITNKGTAIVLDERVYNNKDLENPLAPSDTVKNYIAFLDRNCKEWGEVRNVFVDNADQATMKELGKYKAEHPECLYIFNNSYKKLKIIDRIKLQIGWFHNKPEAGITPSFFVAENCVNYIRELEVYSWDEEKDNTPEDGNDHMINSVQYAWIPYSDKIRTLGGDERNGDDEEDGG